MKTTVLSIVTSCLLVACSNSNSQEEMTKKEGLNGDWVIVKAEGMMADENVGTHYIFDGDKLTFSKGGFDNPAKSTITDSTFTWENGSMTMEYSYYFQGENLIVKPLGGDQTFTLER